MDGVLGGGSREIDLGGGDWAIVDADVFDVLTILPWHGARKQARGSVYAKHTSRPAGGRKSGRRTVMLHRIVTLAKLGDVVDHISGNTLDNRRANLRICTPRQNSENVVSSKNRKAGGFKGVSWNRHAGKWEAGIVAGAPKPDGRRKRLYLGLFVDPIDAALTYDAELRKNARTLLALVERTHASHADERRKNRAALERVMARVDELIAESEVA